MLTPKDQMLEDLYTHTEAMFGKNITFAILAILAVDKANKLNQKSPLTELEQLRVVNEALPVQFRLNDSNLGVADYDGILTELISSSNNLLIAVGRYMLAKRQVSSVGITITEPAE